MRVICVSESGDALPASALDSAMGIRRDDTFDVSVGEEYTVYAITILKGHCWYFVFDRTSADYPKWNPAALFEVSDPSLPASWVFGYIRVPGREEYPVISFPEWALDGHFYERLVDGFGDATDTFASRRIEAEA